MADSAISAECVDGWARLDLLSSIYEDRDLACSIVELEATPEFVDKTQVLANLVNTSKSSQEPVSGWVRYREAYSPRLVELILEDFPIDQSKHFVLDPMCGSGSTQLAAQRLGYVSLGMDVSPYATLVSRVKVRGLEEDEIAQLRDWVRDIEAELREVAIDQNDPTIEYLRSYFPPEHFGLLIAIRRRINLDFRAQDTLREFSLVALLAILEDCSNHKKDGNGLARRPSRIGNAIECFESQIETMMAESLSSNRLQRDCFTQTRTAKELATAVKEFGEVHGMDVGSIIFSPPYPNSFDYFESYKLELLFGQLFDLDSIRTARKGLIRSYRQSGTSSPMQDLDTLERLISIIQERIPIKEAAIGRPDGRSRLLPNLLRGYFTDMGEVLCSAFEAMPPGARMHIVVDQSAYLGVPIPSDLLLGAIGQQLGFEFERLTLCRRARTSAQQLKAVPLLAELIRETVVTLRHPQR